MTNIAAGFMNLPGRVVGGVEQSGASWVKETGDQDFSRPKQGW